MSLLSLVVTSESTGVVRVMRALRVLRIFGRLPSLRKVCLCLRAFVQILRALRVLRIFGRRPSLRKVPLMRTEFCLSGLELPLTQSRLR